MADLTAVSAYGRALCREIAMAAPRKRGNALETLYFGGGTPSLLPPSVLSTILDQVDAGHGLDAATEITLEVNPGTVDLDYLKAVRSLGVNRLSMGIQSFDEGRLKFLSRIHSVSQARRAIEQARQAGFDNLGLDLIYGLPGETEDQRRQELEAALNYDPEHLSCYMLTFEPGTPLGDACQGNQFVPMDAEALSRAFLDVSRYLENQGYRHYEISNFAREGKGWYSRHNSAYWQMVPYRGYGPAAHSLDVGADGDWRRFWNLPDVGAYIRALDAGEAPGREVERLNRDQKIIEWIMVGLRTREGIDVADLNRRLNADFYSHFKVITRSLMDQGLARDREDRFALTRAGWARLDNIVESFYDSL